MDSCPPNSDACTQLVCHCLQISEDRLLEVLARCEIRTVGDIRKHTGAGDGCTACHRRLKAYLESGDYASSPPICSAK